MLIVEAARTNIDRQFAQDEVKKFIADAARERIDKTSPAIIYAAVSSNFLVYVQTATNGIDAVIAKSAYPQPAKESFSASDSNRVTILRFGNGASQIFLRLNGVPLESSIQVTASGHGQQFPVGYWRSISNVTFTYFAQGGDPSELQFEAHYIMDIHQTNAIQRVEVRGNKVFMDGNWVRFLQNGDTP
jgi:hypothetical protein